MPALSVGKRNGNGNKRILLKGGIFIFILLALGLWYYIYTDTKERQRDMIAFEQDRLIMENVSRVLHESTPRVLYWENFLTSEECDSIVEMAMPDFKRSEVAINKEGKETGHVNDVRTSSGAWLSRHSSVPALKKFTRRVSLWSSISKDHGETIQVLQYDKGQYYKPHYDFFNPIQFKQFLANGGQRVASVLCFLNDVVSGGETVFPLAYLSIKPKKGAAILWFNAYLNGTEDPSSQHGGEPVQEGTKYVIIQWMRQHARY